MHHYLKLQEENEQARLKSEILEWLVPAKSLIHHLEAQKKRVRNTCEWFLQAPSFVAWRTLDEPVHDMLCTGGPGVGKTILTSCVFDYLRTKYSGSDVVVMNYYCSHFEEEAQTAIFLAKVLLRQVCQHLGRLPSAVIDFYRNTRHDAEDILWSQCLQDVLRRVVSTCEHVFLVVDALDEIQDTRQRNAFLKVIQYVRSSNSNMRVLATSRPHLLQLHEYFNHPSIVDVSANSQDVRMFLRQRLIEYDDLDMVDEVFREEVIDKLSSGFNGTFLLPALQLNNVLQQITKTDMKRALQDISNTLDDAYRTTLDRVYSLPLRRRTLAFETMMWVSHAKQPLTMRELQHALATKEDNKSLDNDDLVPARTIIEVTAGLVQFDQETSYVTFFHFSVDEYLRSQPGIFLDSESRIVRTCLAYLLLDSVKRLPSIRSKESTAEFLKNHPLMRYAAYRWGEHAQTISFDEYSDLALPLLTSVQHVLAISRVRHIDHPYARNWYKQAEAWAASNTAGISIASYHGLADLVEFMAARLPDKSIINTCHNISGNLPLHDAAGYGHTQVCEVLVAHGADLMATNKRRSTPFFNAVTYGRLETARALLKHNRDQLNVHCRNGWTALHKAAESGDEAVVRFLLHEGASVAAEDEQRRIALHVAAKRGHYILVQLLVLAGANVNAISREETSLDLAAMSGHTEVVQYLVDQGAVLDNPGRDGWSPLMRACRGGYLDIVRLLLRAGADVLWKDYQHSTCLSMASRAGDLRIVEALVEHDPLLALQMLKKKDKKSRNAQHVALMTAHIDVYKYLRDLEDKLDTTGTLRDNTQSCSPLVALSQAIEAKNSVLIEALIRETPALLHHADGSGQLPIHTAFIECAADVATFLLESGASIHARGFNGWQPLHIAASVGSLEMTEMALRYGADIEARTDSLQTPLLKAAASSSVVVVEYLLRCGADIRARNDRGMTCLHIAASKRFLEGLRLFLSPEWEAQDLIQMRDRHKNYARDWADRSGYLEGAMFLKLQEKLIGNLSGGRSKSWTSDTLRTTSRMNTNKSLVDRGVSSPPSTTPTRFGGTDEVDVFAQMVLELDSD